MAPFRRLSDLELNASSDDEIVAYMVEARAVGQPDCAREALQVLVFGRMDAIEARVRRKVSPEAVDMVAGEAFMSAVVGTLKGEHTGEFVNWLNTIVDRRIADYHRAKRLETEPLAEEHEDDDDVRGGGRAVPDVTGAIELAAIVDEIKAGLEPAHGVVVDLYCLEGYPARATADRVNETCADLDPPMSENNVHQIASRFRVELRGRLDEGPG